STLASFFSWAEASAGRITTSKLNRRIDNPSQCDFSARHFSAFSEGRKMSGRKISQIDYFFFGSSFFGSGFFGSSFLGSTFLGSSFFGSVFFGSSFFGGGGGGAFSTVTLNFADSFMI